MKRTSLVCRMATFLGAMCSFVGAVMGAEPRPGPIVEVFTFYDGMPASSIESDITTRVERWVSQASGASRVESRSLEGLSILRVCFDPGVEQGAALKQVNSLATAAIPNLPPGTLPPVILPSSPVNLSPAGLVIISGDKLNEADAKELAREPVRGALQTVPGVAVPSVLGGKDRVTHLSPDAKKLKELGLSSLDLVNVLETNKYPVNVLSLGDARIPLGDYSLDSKDLYAALEKASAKNGASVELRPAARDLVQLGNLVIRETSNPAVRLRDVAEIKNVPLPQTRIVRVNGHRVVCIPVYLQRGEDARAVSKALHTALPSIAKKLPQKVELRYMLEETESERQLTLLLRTATGSLADTEKTVAEVERFLKANLPTGPRCTIVSDIGRDMSDRWTSTQLGWNVGPRNATVRVQLDDKEKATDVVARLRHRFRQEKQFADLTTWFQVGAAARPPVRIRLKGKDLDALMTAAAEVRKEATGAAGAVDVLVAVSPPIPLMTISVDQQKAAALGLKPLDVFRQAAVALGEPDEPLDVIRNRVSIPLNHYLHVDAVLGTPVRGATVKGAIKLGSLIQLKRSEMATEITRVDSKRVVDIWVNVEGRSAAEVARAVEERVKHVKVPKGVSVEVSTD